MNHLRPSAFTMGLGSIVLLFLILPNLVIVPLSFSAAEFSEFPPREWSAHWYVRFFANAHWTDALWRSAQIGIATCALSCVLGVGAALALSRAKLPLARAFSALLLAPLVVPHVVLAAGLFVFFVPLHILQTTLGLIIAHTIIATPIVILTVSVALQTVRRDLELAAASLGASWTQSFFRVLLPQILPGIGTGALLAFVASFDETTLSIFLGGVQSTTLPMRMWEGITVESNPLLPTASTLLLLGSTAPLLALELYRRRKAK